MSKAEALGGHVSTSVDGGTHGAGGAMITTVSGIESDATAGVSGGGLAQGSTDGRAGEAGQGHDTLARLGVLDGWRGISILCVLAAHLMPMGPKAWRLNETVGPLGMALFFTLSGFLVTSFLIKRPDVPSFLLRRGARILPLAWMGILVGLTLSNTDPSQWAPYLLFYANGTDLDMAPAVAHFWSLCVEVQFYVAIALAVALLGSPALRLLPLACLLVTAARVMHGAEISIQTWFRIDEILVGGVLALAHAGLLGDRVQRFLRAVPALPMFGLLIASCHPDSGALNYFRPYLAMLLVGSTLYRPQSRTSHLLANTRWLSYVAAVSFALYVIHPLLAHSWLGEGDTLVRYLKRPGLLAVLFVIAHFSTFHFERYFTDGARHMSRLSVKGYRPA